MSKFSINLAKLPAGSSEQRIYDRVYSGTTITWAEDEAVFNTQSRIKPGKCNLAKEGELAKRGREFIVTNLVVHAGITGEAGVNAMKALAEQGYFDIMIDGTKHSEISIRECACPVALDYQNDKVTAATAAFQHSQLPGQPGGHEFMVPIPLKAGQIFEARLKFRGVSAGTTGLATLNTTSALDQYFEVEARGIEGPAGLAASLGIDHLNPQTSC